MKTEHPYCPAQIRAECAQAPIRLMFRDEARFGRLKDVRRSWVPEPLRPVCRVMLAREQIWAVAAVDVASDAFGSLILPHVNNACTQVLLGEVAARHPEQRLAMLLDGAGWHAASGPKAPSRIRLPPLPPCAPRLKPVDQCFDELRGKCLHSLDGL